MAGTAGPVARSNWLLWPVPAGQWHALIRLLWPTPQAADPYALNSVVGVGHGGVPLNVSARLTFVFKTDDWEFNDDFSLYLSFWDLVLSMGLELELDGN